MKRIALMAILLLSGTLNAAADNNVWTNLRKQPRSDDLLHADISACEQSAGDDLNGAPTSSALKRCMRAHGWRFDRTEREKTWVDPDTGLTCKDLKMGGQTIGSDCSNM
jgi:hypothetical protein